MSLIHSFTRKGLLVACFFLVAPVWLTAQTEEEDPSGERLLAPEIPGSDMVDRIVFRDETTDQVLDLLERLTGRSIIRPQALPAATFTFNSQKPMTREEAILALESMLTINGIGVTPLGDLFLKVVPLAQLRTQAPEFLMESSLHLPPSGRVVSRMIDLEFLSLEDIQTQLNLMITSGSGSIIPFPKANSMLITDTVSNLQAIEELLDVVDRPYPASTETYFFPIRYARAEELVPQIESLAGVAENPELSGRTILTADERSNQIILVTDARQMPRFASLIEKLDVQAELQTQNEVIFLKHANAGEVASILSQLAGGRSGGGSGPGARSGGSGGSNPSGGLSGSRSGQRSGMQSSQRGRSSNNSQRQSPQRQPNVPQPPAVRAQQAEGGGSGNSPAGGAEAAIGALAGSVNESDFSENLTILPDERSNAIVLSGTKQDVALITDLVEKIDIILAQVRIEVFIAEVTLDDYYSRGITQFGINIDDGKISASVQGPGYSIGKNVSVVTGGGAVDWTALFTAAETNSNINVLSVPTIVTTHNKEASILVGEQRPIITGTVTDSFSTTSTRSQVDYRKIGIELYVLPLIGTDGTIQLEIEQIVEDIIGEIEVDDNDQPIIGTREATSFVSVANGETVILGGLQSTSEIESGSRLGILGQIPILGNLFTSRSKDLVRRELLVFIRPTVLATTADAHRDAQEQIGNFSRGEQLNNRLDPEGYPDPTPAPERNSSGYLTPNLSDEARELPETVRRQNDDFADSEQQPAQPEPPAASEPPSPAPAPVHEPVPPTPETVVEEKRAPERETVEPEPRRPVRRGTGAGGRL